MQKDYIMEYVRNWNTVPQEKKEQIMRLFWRNQLREGELVVDNRATKIAAEVGMKTSAVSQIIDMYLKQKYKN